jgi:phosphoglycolate phosphatase-like HAD superfamily hydrolase
MARDGKLLHSGFAMRFIYAWAKRKERNPMKRILVVTSIIVVLFVVFIPQAGAQIDPLLSWNDGPAKQRIFRFVEKVTKENGPDYVPPAECIAVFDSDGTLWPERPLPTELYFVIQRLTQLAPKHPQWRKTPPFKVLFEKNPKALMTLSKQNIEKLMAAAYAGMTQEDFRHEVQNWMATWQHPQLKVGVKGLYYEPMHELLDYLRGNGFKTFIVTGGSSDFVRALSEPLYGVPIDQVVGTDIGLRYKLTGGKSFVVRDPKVTSLENGPLKPVNIERHIGRRPLIAVGNGKSDIETFAYASDRHGMSLCMVITHDDASREFEYRADEVLKQAQERGWLIVSIKRDWKLIFSK